MSALNLVRLTFAIAAVGAFNQCVPGGREIGVPSHLVCLTFDFDAIALWIALGKTSPTDLSRGEFGAVAAMRLMTLLKELNIPSTWFIPGLTIDTYPDICRAIADAGHEIGHHGYDHLSPVGLHPADEKRQLDMGNEAIARVTGSGAAGYRSPAWDLSDNSVALLLEAGFVYDSSMMGHDYLPYFARSGDVALPGQAMKFGETTSLKELPISWSADDFPHFEYFRGSGLRAAADVHDNWLDDYLYMAQTLDEGVMTYTCHPFVIGRGHRIRMLDRLLRELQDRGAQFVTASDALARLLPNK